MIQVVSSTYSQCTKAVVTHRLRTTTYHREHHAKIFGWAKYAAHGPCSTNNWWPMCHSTWIGDKQKSLCAVC